MTAETAAANRVYTGPMTPRQDLDAFDGQQVVLTITAPIKRGRSYQVETSEHTGRLRLDRLGASLHDQNGRMVVATFRAYVADVKAAK